MARNHNQQITEALESAVTIGTSDQLAQLITNLPLPALRRLRRTIDRHYGEAKQLLEAGYEKAIFAPENFFDRERSARLDAAYQETKLRLISAQTEARRLVDRLISEREQIR